jgi:hypothetical protein
VILTARSSRCPRSLETRTEHGFPISTATAAAADQFAKTTKPAKIARGLPILVQNRKNKLAIYEMTCARGMSWRTIGTSTRSDLVRQFMPE